MRRSTAVLLAAGITLAGTVAAQGPGQPKTFYLMMQEGPLKAALECGKETLEGKGYPVSVAEVIAVGPAVHGLQKGSSAEKLVEEAVAAGVKVVACEYAMKHENVKASSLIEGVETVPNGFYEAFTRQQQGYIFIML